MTAREREERVAALGYDYASRRMERVTRCALCDGERHVELARRDRYGFPARLQVCAGCGLGFLSPRLVPEEYSHFYDGVYRPLVSAYHGRRIDAETVQEEQRGYALELAEFLDEHLPVAPRTVLDVGGSTGVVGAALGARFGARVTVLDPSPDELAVAAAAGMETVSGFAEDFAAQGRTWDLVLLCQTIDHLLDLRRTLAALRSMTATGGAAFVDLLDVGFMARRRGSIEGAVKIDHPFYLTRATGIALFEQSGFRVAAERLSDDGHWGFVLLPGAVAEPDLRSLAGEAGELLALAAALRATS